MPKPDPAYYDSELEQKWDRILALRDDANRALESARAARVIGKSLEASVVISAKGEDLSFIKSIGQQLTGILIVSSLEITDTDIDGISGENYPGVKIRVAQASGVKCPRCWVITENPGTNPAHPELCPRCTDVVSRIV
jgi:isoleucyl-tRNA synthetase